MFDESNNLFSLLSLTEVLDIAVYMMNVVSARVEMLFSIWNTVSALFYRKLFILAKFFFKPYGITLFIQDTR